MNRLPRLPLHPPVETAAVLTYSGRMSDTPVRRIEGSMSRRAVLGMLASAAALPTRRLVAQASARGLLVCGDSMVKTVARSARTVRLVVR